MIWILTQYVQSFQKYGRNRNYLLDITTLIPKANIFGNNLMIAMILAGGTGTRLWPYSRSMTPKQFLNLGSTQDSLFQETCKRLESLVSPEEIYVVGSEEHVGELKEQILNIFLKLL